MTKILKIHDTDHSDELLTAMLTDLQTAGPLYRPTNFWSAIIEEVVTTIHKRGIQSFRNADAKTYFVPHYTEAEKKYFISAEDDYRIFMAADTNCEPHLGHISESKVGSPTQHYRFDDRNYSRSMLNYLRGLAFLKKTVDTSSIKTVLEIGGGYGTLGEIFLKSNPEKYCYVDIDIPPTAYVATRYLQEVFGEKNIIDYFESKELKEIDLEKIFTTYHGAILMPWQLPCIIGHIDLFVNFFSFQEMEPHVVKNYANFIDGLSPQFLLLRNQRTGKKLADKPGQIGVLEQTTREHYIEFFTNYRCVAIDSNIFGCIKDGFESEVMIFKRKE